MKKIAARLLCRPVVWAANKVAQHITRKREKE